MNNEGIETAASFHIHISDAVSMKTCFYIFLNNSYKKNQNLKLETFKLKHKNIKTYSNKYAEEKLFNQNKEKRKLFNTKNITYRNVY